MIYDILNAPNAKDTKERNLILWLIHLSLVIGLLALIFMVMRPFIVPLLWSAVLAISLLPLFRLLEFRLSNRSQLAAFLLTAGLALIFMMAVVPLIWHLASELLLIIRSFEGEGKELFIKWVRQIESFPIIGPLIAPYLLGKIDDGYAGILQTLKIYNATWLSLATKTLSNIATLIFSGFISILSLHFLLANASTIVRQIQNGALALGGPTYLELLVSVYETVRVTLRGILLTAVAQAA